MGGKVKQDQHSYVVYMGKMGLEGHTLCYEPQLFVGASKLQGITSHELARSIT